MSLVIFFFQVEPTVGGPLALAGTFLLLSGLFAGTAHIAARYVLGSVPAWRAVLVGPVPAAITLGLQQSPTVVMILVGIGGDFIAIYAVYRVRFRDVALITGVHYTVSVILSITFASLIALLSLALG